MSNAAKGLPQEVGTTAEDWRRLQRTLLRAEEQLDLRLEKEVDSRKRSGLLQERAQLRKVLSLCEALLVQTDQQHREARVHASSVPVTEGLAAFNLQMNAMKVHATRATHTVLVVDDHQATRYVATRLLKRAGYKVLEAATGEEALVRSDEASALLLDVNLPDLNGVEVCQVIKKHSRWKPVILMSAVFTDELHRYAGKTAGADLYLTSALDGEQLASSFDRLLAP